MATGGGGAGVEGDGEGLLGGRPCFLRQVLFGPGFNMGCVDLDSEEEQESVVMEEMSPEEQFTQPPSPSSQFACSMVRNTQTEDPLSHYQSPNG
jgi:hypothetical protein